MTHVYPALAATLAVQVMVSLAGLTAPVLAPLAALDFGVEPHLVGFFFALQYVFASLSGLVSGSFIGRYGAIRVSQVCLLLSAVAMGVAAVADSIVLVLAAVIMGLAYGPSTPASSQILARVAPPRMFNLVFSIKQTGVPLGNMLAGALLPTIALGLGWRGAALAVAVATLSLMMLLEPLRDTFDADRDPRRPFASGIVAPLRTVLRTPALRLLAFTSLAFSAMQASLAAFLVTYLHTEIGLTLVLAGFLLSAAQISGAAGRIVWGIIADHTARPMLVLGVLGLAMSAGAVMAGFFTQEWPFVGLFGVCVVFGATAVAWNGVFVAEVARQSPAGQVGEVTGATTFLTFGGVTMGPALFTLILSTTDSYALGYWTMAALTCISGLFYLGARTGEGAAPPARSRA